MTSVVRWGNKDERREAHTFACPVAASKIPGLRQTPGLGRCVFFKGYFALARLLLFTRRASPVAYQLPIRSMAVAGAGVKPISWATGRVGAMLWTLVCYLASCWGGSLLAHREAQFACMSCSHTFCLQCLLSPYSAAGSDLL